MSDFWVDYFKYNTGGKILNTLGGVLLRNKWQDLQDKYNKGQELTDPQKPDTTKSSNPLGYPMQDLNKQPAPDYNAPTTAGNKSPLTEEDANKQEFGSPQPNAFINTLGGNTPQTPLLNNQDKPKVDFSGIGQMVDPVKRKQFNDKLQNDVMEFMNYAQRFPEQGQRYAPMLEMFMKNKQLNAPEKIEAGKEFTDKNGMLYERQYNPYKNQWLTVPVTGEDGKQIQTKLPEVRDLNEIDFYLGENGNAWYKDPTTGVASDSGIRYRDRFPKYGLQEDAMNLKEDQFAWKQTNGKTGNSSHSSNSSGDGSSGITIKGKTPVVNGVPLTPTTKKVLKNSTEIIGNNPDGTPMYRQYEADEFGYDINGKFVPKSELDKIADDLGSKNPMKVNFAIQNAEALGITIDNKGNAFDKKKTEESGEEQKWKKLWNDQIKNAKNPKSPAYQQAVEWLADDNNIKYAEKLGLIK